MMKEKKIDITYTEYENLSQLEEKDRILAETAIRSAENAYSPYSNFSVGAALRLSNGEIITGANQENIAYPSGLCAERTAMFYASAQYPAISMESIAIAGKKDGTLCPSPATPCGACRQVMAEYQDKGGRKMEIILVGSERICKFSKVDDLLPLTFDSLK